MSAVAALPLGKVDLLLWQRWIIAATSIAAPTLGKVGSSIPSEVMLPDVGCWSVKERGSATLGGGLNRVTLGSGLGGVTIGGGATSGRGRRYNT